MLIGVIGRVGEGKTSVAEHLKSKYGFKILSFATPLKEAVSLLFNIPMPVLCNPTLKTKMIPEWGKSPREILQIFGTECMRNHFGFDFWVKQMLAKIDFHFHRDIVIDDVRFQEEINMVKSQGGQLIRVIRPKNPYKIDQEHASEQVPNTYSAVILVNAGTIEGLHAEVDNYMTRLRVSGGCNEL